MNEKMTIEEMEQRIEQYGHKAIWQTIEKMNNWQDRVMYRFLFFKAGGSLDD